MNKKAYIVPAVEVQTIKVQQMICGSVTAISGDSGIEQGEGDPLEEAIGGADSRGFGLWDDED
ncbi:MAG: hypothetical protein IJ081_04405 [Prevotella sp.]|nr:hypothetical protein [Prevotella sp.]